MLGRMGVDNGVESIKYDPMERRDTADAAKTEQPRFSIRNCYKLHLNARSHRFSYAKSPISAPRLGQMSLFTRWVSLTGH